jgi:hypothetical protein
MIPPFVFIVNGLVLRGKQRLLLCTVPINFTAQVHRNGQDKE